MSDRFVCSLINEDANAASIEGQDGGVSVAMGGASYFLFGDTAIAPGELLIPNNAGVSTDNEASDCLKIQRKSADGQAQPLVGQSPGEMTLWPGAPFSVVPDYVHAFVASVPGPSVWYVRGIGMIKFRRDTMVSSRVHELLWENDGSASGIGGAGSAIVAGGNVYVFLHTANSSVLLARIRATSVESASEWRYWDGKTWGADISGALPLWTQSDGSNGVSVRWSAVIGKWVAVYNASVSFVRVRTAPALTGPWSEERAWIDCGRWSPRESFPLCYSAAFHPQFDREGGKRIYITYSTTDPYEVVLHELRLGTPVYQWRSGADVRLAIASPGSTFTREGIVLYASDTPAEGFEPIRRWVDATGGSAYRVASPGGGWNDAGIAFYAPGSEDAINVELAPVYEWTRGSERIYSAIPGVEALGFTRGEIAFDGVCGDTDLDTVNDCDEAWAGSDPLFRDTDGDSFGDHPAGSSNPNEYALFDNCPLEHNSDQGNTSGEPTWNGAGEDATNPNQDVTGDACDADLDGDGLENAEEASVGSDAIAYDSDRDAWPDGVEISCGSDPLDYNSVPKGADADSDGAPDECEALVGTPVNDHDGDHDRVSDVVELRWGTDPSDADSDGDGYRDGCEIASVDEDRAVTTRDLYTISRRIVQKLEPMGADVNRDGVGNVLDLAMTAALWNSCR